MQLLGLLAQLKIPLDYYRNYYNIPLVCKCIAWVMSSITRATTQKGKKTLFDRWRFNACVKGMGMSCHWSVMLTNNRYHTHNVYYTTKSARHHTKTYTYIHTSARPALVNIPVKPATCTLFNHYNGDPYVWSTTTNNQPSHIHTGVIARSKWDVRYVRPRFVCSSATLNALPHNKGTSSESVDMSCMQSC